jgi:hypothetical protein
MLNKKIYIFIALLLLGALGWQIVNNYFDGHQSSIKELHTNKQPAKKIYAEENNKKTISQDSDLPLVLSTKSISDQINKERISRARETYEAGSRREKIQALHLLMHISPADASAILQELLKTTEKTTESLGFIRHLMAGLSEEKAYLSDTDIRFIYSLNDPVAQKIAVIILDDRGDNSLNQVYVKSRESKLNSQDSNERLVALQEIGSVSFASANHYFVKALKDSDSTIKIQAIEHLMDYGNNTNIADIETLLQDSNPSVVERAKKAVQSLSNNQEYDELPLSRRLMQPGFPVNGLVPD